MTWPRNVTLPLAAMLLTQTAASMSLSTVPVLAPLIASDAGIDPGHVGTYTALVFGAAMVSSSMSGTLIQKFGPLRSNQLVLVLSAVGLFMCVAPAISMIIASALFLGFGYGPNTPSSSQVLAQVAPEDKRGLIFSIKQSGSPLGAVAAGLLLPWLADGKGWQLAVGVSAALVLSAAFIVQPLRQRTDHRADEREVKAFKVSITDALRTIAHHSLLRRMTLAAFLLMVVHTCIQAFTVTFLVEHVGIDLIFAGALFAVLSISAFISRIALGWLSDSIMAPRKVLVSVATCAVVACAALASVSQSWPVWCMALVSAMAGLSSSGWYGVFLAEVSRRSIPGQEGLATGGALFFVYSSIVAGPLLFMAVRFSSDGYPASLYMLSAIAAVAAVMFARAT